MDNKVLGEPVSDWNLKIERANQHISDIEARVIALHNSDTSRVEIHPQFGTERLIHEFTDAEAFRNLAVMLGDAVHNLNCALDYVWWRAAKRFIPTVNSERTKLPVRETVEELEGWLKGAGKKTPAIHSLCPALSNFLLNQVRPYRGGNHAIWPIHVLDNIDKHRLLIPVLSSAYIEGMVVVDEDGEPWHGFGVSNFQRPPYVVDLAAGLHFKEKGKLTVGIIVKNGKLTHGLRIPFTLSHYSKLIVEVVEAFEAFNETDGLGGSGGTRTKCGDSSPSAGSGEE